MPKRDWRAHHARRKALDPAYVIRKREASREAWKRRQALLQKAKAIVAPAGSWPLLDGWKAAKDKRAYIRRELETWRSAS